MDLRTAVDQRAIDEIRRILSENLLVEVESADSDLLESGLLDSLRLVDLLLHLERVSGLSIDMGTLEIESFRTMTRIAELVERHRLMSAGDHA